MNSVDSADGADLSVKIAMTKAQATVIKDALDFYVRISLGQVGEVADAVRSGFLKPRGRSALEALPDIEVAVDALKRAIGFEPGASYGIGSDAVHPQAKLGYELKKVIDRALSIDRDPSPKFKGVNYDGVTVRYTDSPLAVVQIDPSSSESDRYPTRAMAIDILRSLDGVDRIIHEAEDLSEDQRKMLASQAAKVRHEVAASMTEAK